MKMAKYETHVLFISLAMYVIDSMGHNPDVETSAGKILGKELVFPDLKLSVEAYLGIPYAEPPIKDLRFKDPKIPNLKNRSYVINLNEFPPSCPQFKIKLFEGFKGMEGWKLKTRIDEDCLYLNIWATKKHGTNKSPVIVYIHGGGFNFGGTSVSSYDGSYLAALTDSIVVTIQYRLGSLGFLYTGDDFAPGNAGLKDQVLALKWVNEHIHHFGGDKDRITLAGQSAGSASVGFHVLSPQTNKLFDKGILLSGVPNCFWTVIPSQNAKENSLALAGRLGADTSKYEDVKKKLLTTPWQDIIKVQDLFAVSMFKVNFVPSVEPTLVPEHPSVMITNAEHLEGKELIISWTREEGSLFAAIDMYFLNKTNSPIDTPIVDRNLYKDRLAVAFGRDKNLLETVANHYEPDDKSNYLRGVIDAYSDVTMRCPIIQFVDDAKMRKAKIFQFEYNHRTKNNAWPEWMGTEHGADLEMFFAFPLKNGNEYSNEDKKLCQNFTDLLKEFITTKTGTSILNMWDEQNVLKLGYSYKEPEDRSMFCRTLNKMTTDYEVKSEANAINLGILVILLSFVTTFVLLK